MTKREIDAERSPLSPLQEGLLFQALYNTDPRGPDVYVMQFVVTLEGQIDVPALQAAGRTLLRRHANLRAGFGYHDADRLMQVVPREVPLPWQEVDLSNLDAKQCAAERDRLLMEDRNRRFDLAVPPLVRFTLIRSGGGASHFVLTNHHVLLDGWSHTRMLRELFTLYACDGDDSQFPPAASHQSYLDWLAAQDRSAAQQAWRTALEGLDEPTLVANAANAVNAATAVNAACSSGSALPERVVIDLSENFSRRLTHQAQRSGLSLNAVIQGAWGVLLGWSLRRQEVVFGGTVSACPPPFPGGEATTGLFANIVPIRMRLRPDESLRHMLLRLQGLHAELTAHQHLDLGEITRLAMAGELFDTLAVLESEAFGVDDLRAVAPDLRVRQVEHRDANHYPLSFSVVPGPRVRLRLDFRADLFERTWVEQFMGRIHRLLEAFVRDPDQPVGRVDLLTDDERTQVLRTWNDSDHEGPRVTLTVFEDQVARRPDAVALLSDNATLNYRELNARANALARLLMREGIGPERIVALALPRSVELIVALLAVVKAGGAYLPLAPDYPADRIAYMLTDAQPALLVTTTEVASGLLAGAGPRRILLDEASTVAALADMPDGNPTDAERHAPLLLSSPAYVIYTSGSTGKPKGVVVTHAGISSFAAAEIEHFAVDADSRVLQLFRPASTRQSWKSA